MSHYLLQLQNRVLPQIGTAVRERTCSVAQCYVVRAQLHVLFALLAAPQCDQWCRSPQCCPGSAVAAAVLAPPARLSV